MSFSWRKSPSFRVYQSMKFTFFSSFIVARLLLKIYKIFNINFVFTDYPERIQQS